MENFKIMNAIEKKGQKLAFLLFMGCLSANFYLTKEDPTLSGYFQNDVVKEWMMENAKDKTVAQNERIKL